MSDCAAANTRKKMRRRAAPPQNTGPKTFGHLTLNTYTHKSLLIELDFDLLFAAVTHDDKFKFARTFLTDQTIEVRSRFDRLSVYSHDAIARFQSVTLPQLSGGHLSDQNAAIWRVEKAGQLLGERRHAHAKLIAIGVRIVTGDT